MAHIASSLSRRQISMPTVTKAIMESFPAKAPSADIKTTMLGTRTLTLLSSSLNIP